MENLINSLSLEDFKKEHVFITAKTKKETTKPWIKNIQETILVKYSHGIILQFDESKYVLTTFHGVKRGFDIKMYQMENITKNINKYELELLVYSDEMDLALFSIKKYSSVGINLDTFESKFPNRSDKLKLLVYKIIKKKKIIDHNIQLNFRYLECNNEEVNFVKQCSFNMPLIPILSINLRTIISELDGISGSCIYDENDKIVGIVSNINNKTNLISLIPSILIKRFLKEYIINNRFCGLCDIISELNFCDINIGTEKFCGYLVKNNYGINYNKYSHGNKDTIGFNLKKNDIIISVNNIQINKDGKLWHEEIQYFVPLSTYMALSFFCGDLIQLKLYRSNNNNYEYKEIKLKNRPVSTARFIPISLNNKIVEYNGLIFMEVSEELINICEVNDIHLSGDLLFKLINQPFRNNYQNLVVLVDIVESKFDPEILKEFKKCNLSLINSSFKHPNLCILSKINKKIVTDIHKTEKILKNSNRSIMYLNFDKKKKMRIVFEDNKLLDLILLDKTNNFST
ncbi:Hypothetical protein KVN_LOCUS258 [uncultured virus]|nr:Hypothetical protein KVN_LOCUS258 [uncultured virus]